jgi:voltage-gated potassium channel
VRDRGVSTTSAARGYPISGPCLVSVLLAMETGVPPGGTGSRTWRGRKDPNRDPATPLRLSDLDSTSRRRATFRCGATIVLCWVVIFGAFYALPIGHESDVRAFVRLGIDVVLIGAVFVWLIRRISMAELPELRAIEALGVVVALFLVAFSGIYVAMSHESAATFSQPLDHTRSLYFTITVFSTVGFGDITPRTDPARLVVAAQMLLDLAIIGALVRLIFNAARSRIAPSDGPAAGGAT